MFYITKIMFRSLNKTLVNPNSQSLEFQIVDWRAYDNRSFNDEDDEDGEGEEEQKVERKYLIEIYGFDKEKRSVCLTVTDFTPYFFVEIPRNWTVTKLNNVIERVKAKVDSYVRNDLIDHKIVERKRFFGFCNEEKYTFVRLTFKSRGAFYAYKKQLEGKIAITNAGANEIVTFKGKMYETDMDPMLRFIHLRDIDPAGWIKVAMKEFTTNSNQSSKCNLDFTCHWKKVHKSPEMSIGAIRIMSFDIECTSVDGSFPKYDRQGDKIIQIGSTCHEYGSREIHFRHIATLGKSGPVEGGVMVESYATERDLLIGWAKMVEKYDPDIITGYNIFGFDWEYLYMRAKLGMGNNKRNYSGDFLRLLSRSRKIPAAFLEKELSSSALGDNMLKYVDCPGRVPIDLLKLIQKDHKLDSYKLDNVAEHFLKIRKIDLKPYQIFEKFAKGGPTDIAEIATYCIRDCELCNQLIIKLEAITGNTAMANICTIPFAYLFLRGQGIKIFSLVGKYCQKEGYLIKSREKSEDDTSVEGAYVFTPDPKIWMDPIVVLDYNSLYPSSMISENLSPDTLVDDPKYLNLPDWSYNSITYDVFEGKGDDKKKIGEKTSIFAEKKSGEKGILPRILMQLLKARADTRAKIPQKSVELSDKRVLIGFVKDKGETLEVTCDGGDDGKNAVVVVVKKTEVVGPVKDAYNEFQKAILDGRQLALKITANSIYGQTGAPTSKIFCEPVAASTTATGRRLLRLARDSIIEKYPGTVCIYGDSVVGDTPILLLNTTTNKIVIKTIETLVEEGEWMPYENFKPDDKSLTCKEMAPCPYLVWSNGKWSAIRKVIRHKTKKDIYRITTHTGSVDVTEDHSLLDKNGEIVKPKDTVIGQELLHSYPVLGASKCETLNLTDSIRIECKDKLGASQLYFLMRSLGYDCSIDTGPNIFIITATSTSDSGSSQNKNPWAIKKKELIAKDYREYVYDLETDVGCFQAGVGQMIVKNTDSVFLNFAAYIEATFGKNLSSEEKLKKSYELGVASEKHMSTILKYPHNCGYEKIFYPFIIFTKKRYVGNKYEKDMTKYKQAAMGIALKRRDYAPIVKVIYNNILDWILNKRDQEGAKGYFKEQIVNLLKGQIAIKELVITKNLGSDYANPTTIAHKVLADRMGERDPGNKPQSNDRMSFCFIDASELKCNECGEKKINANNCKCIKCLHMFCINHLNSRKHKCKTVCRFCRISGESVSKCETCQGWYCADDMIKHNKRTDKYKVEHFDKCKKELPTKLLQGDIIETPDYITENGIKLDYRYYLDHQIATPCLQIFELMMKDPQSLIRHAVREDNNTKAGNQAITKWFHPIVAQNDDGDVIGDGDGDDLEYD